MLRAMYAAFFGLQQEPFSIAPDPRFLHLSEGHREALAHLLYGLQAGGGFVLLTGEIGTGKTTVCRCFLEQIPPGHRVAYLYNPRLTEVELLQTICQEFGIAQQSPPATTTKPYVDALNEFLLDAHAKGEQCLLVVDEAQGLSPELLELLRLLTNLETHERKLLQIVLIGQPELRTMLARPELEQLAQRVVARVHLGPLVAAQTADYVRHRLGVAGLQGPLPFTPRALAVVHRESRGVPRRINLLCQRALLGAYAQGRPTVDARTVRHAAREVFETEKHGRRGWIAGSLLLLAIGVGAAGWWAWPGQPSSREGAGSSASAASSVGSRVASSPTPTAATASIAAPEPDARSASPAAAPAASALAGETLAQPFDDARAATAALAAAWGIDAAGADDPCRAARTAGLACFEGKADPALLRRLDRPMLLLLADGQSWLLQGIDDEQAQVQGMNGSRRIALPELQSSWDGRVLAWWRPPPKDTSSWVLQQLLALQGPETAAGARSPADEVLRRRVFAFQLGQGLPLDGLIGPLTLMQLNRVSGVDEPRLRSQP